jgi:hypothetical protein
MKRAIAALSLAGFYFICVLMLGAGCTSYYKVHDPTTGKNYYTADLKQKNGTAMLRDGKSGKTVNVQNSEITKITKEEYDTARYTPTSD